VQDTIRRIDQRLLTWRDNLPPGFDITFDKWTAPDMTDPHTPQRLGLAILFHSARMILCHPCLCRFEGRILKQSTKSKDFSQQASGLHMRALSSHNDFSPFMDRHPNSKDLLHTAMVAHFTLPLRSTISPHARNGIPSTPPPQRSGRNPLRRQKKAFSGYGTWLKQVSAPEKHGKYSTV
jgi:hypothetical protein